MKKILSLLVVAALVMGMCAFSVSADPLVTFKVTVDKTDIAVTKEVNVTVTAKGAFTVFQLDFAYNDDYVTYVAESLAYSNSVTASTTDKDPADGTISLMYMNPSGATFANDTTILTAKFKALDATAFEEAVGEGKSLSAIFDLEVFNDPKKGYAVFGKGDLGEQYVEGEFACTDATVTITLPPTAPTAAPTIDITEPKVGDTLTATSNYSDINGDLESGTTFEWFANGQSLGEASTTNTYVVTGAEVGKTITVKAVPKTTVAPTSGEAAESAATAAVAVNPALKATVEGLKFTDESKFKVGKEIFISYDLISPNAGEDDSDIKWTDAEGNELVGDVAEDGMSFVPDKEDKDMIVKVTVTPKDSLTEANAEAAVFVVAEEAIAKAKSNGGGYVPNSGANLAGKEPVEDKPEEPAKVAFEDVDAEKYAWAVEYINELAEQGIFKGRDEKTFDPEAKITRAEFVALVARVLGIKSDAEIAFADLDGHWAAAEVTAVATLGEDTLAFFGEAFAPDQAITREEMATVLYKALVAKGVAVPEAEAAVFSDASSIAEFAAEAVEALQKFEVINGMGDGTFAPKGETTRAQAAKVIYLFAGLVK